MGRASREKHLWRTPDHQRAVAPARACQTCGCCPTGNCEWRHGLGDAVAGRPDKQGYLVRRAAIDAHLYTAIDFTTMDGATFARSDVQAQLQELAAKDKSLVILLTPSGSPVGIVGDPALQQAFLAKIIESDPKLATAVVDDEVAGQVDRDLMVPQAVKLEKQARVAKHSTTAIGQAVNGGTDLNPVLEFIQ